MTNEQIESEIKHLATREGLEQVRTELQASRADWEKALREQLKCIILLHVPTWTGLVLILFKH